MKQELYYYAISLKSNKISNVPVVCIWIILSVFLIPLILSNTCIGLLVLFTYLLLYFCSKKELDKYNKYLISLGLFLLFLGVELFALILIQHRIIISLVTTILIFLICYEIIWIIKIKRKMYSKSEQNKRDSVHIASWIFGSIGIWFGRLIARSENTDFNVLVGIILISALIVGSCSFFQKYFINKIIKK